MALTKQSSAKRLTRSDSDKMIAGVAGGIAEYFNIDAALIRIGFILITMLGGSGVFAYFILWLIVPPDSSTISDPEQQIKANAKELQTRASSIAKTAKSENNRALWGLFLVGLGIVFLLQNFGIARFIEWGRLWPIILIIFGFSILAKK
jgi:phage shock protein C